MIGSGARRRLGSEAADRARAHPTDPEAALREGMRGLRRRLWVVLAAAAAGAVALAVLSTSVTAATLGGSFTTSRLAGGTPTAQPVGSGGGGPTVSATDPTASPSGLQIDPGEAEVCGEEAPPTLTVLGSLGGDGSLSATLDPATAVELDPATVRWTSDDPAVADVSAEGTVSTDRATAGTTVIRAERDGVAGTATITCTPAGTGTGSSPPPPPEGTPSSPSTAPSTASTRSPEGDTVVE